MDTQYKFNNGYNWKFKPCNTAFLYIKDNLFKNYYITESINFMRHCQEKSNDVCSMVFAEQRLLSVCANYWNIDIDCLIENKTSDTQKSFTHIWGYKDVLKKDNKKEESFV